MFYFTCNESRIYESFTFWNVTKLFHDIQMFWDAPVCMYVYIYIYKHTLKADMLISLMFFLSPIDCCYSGRSGG